MKKATIKINYRHIIDVHAETGFEKNVWHASYEEFLLKSQVYNPGNKFKTFTGMKANDGRANSLHYKTGFAVGHFINQLKNEIPYLYNNLGKNIHFAAHQFEMIESNIINKEEHKVAVIFITGNFILLDHINDYMILAKAENILKENTETFLLKIQPNLSIISYVEIANADW
jgi:hypothetical protein